MTEMTQPEVAYRLTGISYEVGISRILQDIDLDVRYGRVLALVGPNGAGKSTLLSLLAGDATPTKGRIELDGRLLSEWSAHDLATTRAVLLQSNAVAFSFTAREVVEMGRAPWRDATEEEDTRAVKEALEEADVAALAHRAFSSLSGGERARVSLARVLAQDTRILMLDEPTAALDLRHQEDVLRIARSLADRGRAVIAVLHDLSLAGAYADDVAMLSRGRLVAHGSPTEVFTEERVEEVYETPVRVMTDPDTGRPIVLPRRA